MRPIDRAVTAGAAAVLCLSTLAALGQDRPVYRDATRPIDERVRDLLGRMTLEEKVAQTLAVWKAKEKITDASGAFDAQAAATLLPNGVGTIARPSELRDRPTRMVLGPRENA